MMNSLEAGATAQEFMGWEGKQMLSIVSAQTALSVWRLIRPVFIFGTRIFTSKTRKFLKLDRQFM